MSAPTVAKIRKKARKMADEDRREAAAKEAKARWHEVRESLASTADELADAAEDQWSHARKAAEAQIAHAKDVAAPKIGRLKKRATEVLDEDLDRWRAQAGDLAGDVRRSMTRVSLDLKDAARTEADRVIEAVQASAAEAREAERKRRVRALVGWTVFGMVAGAVLATQFGPKGREDEHPADEPQAADPHAEPADDEHPQDGQVAVTS